MLCTDGPVPDLISRNYIRHWTGCTCSTRVSSHKAEAAMLLVVKIDVGALAGKKMRMSAFCGAD